MSCLTAMGCRGGRSHAAPGIAPPDSETERHADRVADAVMANQRVSLPSGAGGGAGIHRQCSECETAGAPCADCAGEAVLQRDRAGASMPSASAAHQAANALSSGGTPMPAALRSYFEPRFGADLSDVRLHPEEPAARAINANAYTMGQHIGFAPGSFAPQTRAGQRLIAHELAHSVQGDGQIHRDAEEEEDTALPEPGSPTTLSETFEDDSGGGDTTFHEQVETAASANGTHLRGTVRRREEAPATDTAAQEDIADHTATVDFDTENCEITLPYRYGFQLAANEASGQFCQGASVTGPVDLNQIAQDYIDGVNAALSNEFSIRLSGCEHDCTTSDIPIHAEAERDDANADTMITVVSRAGRGNAATLCAGDMDESFAAHESGHQVLGRGDEYPERAPALLALMPHWGRPERVRHDYPIMGSGHSYGRFATFHERDFRHVATFMRAAMPGCSAELISSGPVVLDYRVFGFAGGGSLSGTAGFQVGGGFDVGIPLTRGREWSILLGAEASLLGQLQDDERRWVLAGIRMGLEREFRGDAVTGRIFGGGQFGVAHELDTPSPDVAGTPHTGAYGEAELGAGFRFNFSGGGGLGFDLRGRAGGEIGRESPAYWINVGLNLIGRF